MRHHIPANPRAYRSVQRMKTQDKAMAMSVFTLFGFLFLLLLSDFVISLFQEPVTPSRDPGQIIQEFYNE